MVLALGLDITLYKQAQKVEGLVAAIEYKLADMDDFDVITEVGDKLFDYPVKKNRAKEFLQDARHHLVLAKDQGKVVAMASAIHYVHLDKDPALFISEVGVLEEYRNQGIGRATVAYLIKHGKALGCTETWVATENSNDAARNTYKAAGGTEDDELIVMFTFD